jgi:hypothetical protein
LETLILENIDSNQLKTVLQDIASLPNLSSLVIIPVDYVENANDLFLQIFRLSVLKYCKVSFANNQTQSDLLPFATHEYSPIEQLVIKHAISINTLHRLLSYIPQLRRLSLDCINEDYHNSRIDQPMTFNNLSHLFLDLTHFSFDEFELLIKNSFPSIQVLHLLVDDRVEYINANRWEQLISSYMPYLRIFDMQCSYRYVRNSTIQRVHEFQLNQFTTSFWYQRKWFFTYQDYFRYGYHYIIFYSTNPYRYEILWNKNDFMFFILRKKDYKFEKKPNQYHRLNDQETNLSSVRHVHISNEEAIIDCIDHFPNTKELILKDISFRKTETFITTLVHMIPLQNLTKLIVESEDYSFEKLIKLLSFTLNLNTLKIQSIYQEDLRTIQNSETFRLVSNVNMIKNLTVKELSGIEKVELLFALCPRLEQFTIEDRWARVKELLRLLLSKNNRRMFSLCITNENQRLPNKLATLIQGRKLFNNYFIKSDYPKVYLWW